MFSEVNRTFMTPLHVSVVLFVFFPSSLTAKFVDSKLRAGNKVNKFNELITVVIVVNYRIVCKICCYCCCYCIRNGHFQQDLLKWCFTCGSVTYIYQGLVLVFFFFSVFSHHFHPHSASFYSRDLCSPSLHASICGFLSAHERKWQCSILIARLFFISSGSNWRGTWKAFRQNNGALQIYTW